MLEPLLWYQVLGDLGQVLSSLWVGPAVVSGWGSSSQGHPARQAAEGTRVQTFTGPEQALWVQIIENIIFIFRKPTCIMKYNVKSPCTLKTKHKT